jgi:hypothetical protein
VREGPEFKPQCCQKGEKVRGEEERREEGNDREERKFISHSDRYSPWLRKEGFTRTKSVEQC